MTTATMMHSFRRNRLVSSFVCLIFGYQATIVVSSSAIDDMKWEQRSSYDSSQRRILGRHHPIVFANETHGFLIGGTTTGSEPANDFYIYNEANDEWMDISENAAPFPPRSFGYGVVLNEANHPKAYLGFGASIDEFLNDWYEFDMTTLQFKQLSSCPGLGRRHPSMVPVYIQEEQKWQIHVGLGDGFVGLQFSNFNDYWVYDINTDEWTQLPNFPSSQRHHPFFFGIGDTSYTGLGHSDGTNPYIERDFYSYSSTREEGENWNKEPDFASYEIETSTLITTEARVAGTEFSIDLPLVGDDSGNSAGMSGAIGFVLSGDGEDHGTMETGEFHAFYPPNSPLMSWNDDNMRWRQLPPHPGTSRWAPGSFVMRGSAVAYFTSGYDRSTNSLHSDVWRIDLSPLFQIPATDSTNTPGGTTTDGQGIDTDENNEAALVGASSSGASRLSLESLKLTVPIVLSTALYLVS